MISITEYSYFFVLYITVETTVVDNPIKYGKAALLQERV